MELNTIPLAISNIAWAPEQDTEVYTLMHKYGVLGLEIAPTRIFPENPYGDLLRAKLWAERLLETEGFCVPSMQSIWYGRTENLFDSEEAREKLLQYSKQAVDFAAAVRCRNLVFGCPRNRNIAEGADVSTAVVFFRDLGNYAAAHGCCIGMEANPPIYHTNYINTTQQALELVEKVDNPGFTLNLDVGTMLYTGEDCSILKGKTSLISHVHISEPYLKPIQSQLLHRELTELLMTEGYSGYVSVEMARTENIKEVNRSLSYMNQLLS